uniref:PlsC domain-containing protein n=1 Tax=Panagrellus redivivus TaxID=6233 RepID=A0A7E4WAP4_PANRE
MTETTCNQSVYIKSGSKVAAPCGTDPSISLSRFLTVIRHQPSVEKMKLQPLKESVAIDFNALVRNRNALRQTRSLPAMLEVLSTLFWTYVSTLSLAFISTVTLILSGSSWGSLPHKYLQLVVYIQQLFTEYHQIAIDEPTNIMVPSPSVAALIQRDASRCVLARSQSTITAQDMHFVFDSDKENGGSSNTVDMSLDFALSGLQSIVQDEVAPMFAMSPSYMAYELTYDIWTKLGSAIHLKAVCIASLIFRVGFLFPLRILLLGSSFAFAAFWCVIVLFTDLSGPRKTWIAVCYSRLFCAGTGLVARYHNDANRPTRPGIAVSNHLSPNDIQIIAADVDPSREYLYTVTGQRHTGIIGAIEFLVERLCPSLWFNRANNDERKNFTNIIMDEGRRAGPVLIFPEGYCTNNTRVLQFRKAVFAPDVRIHPIAIKQDGRYGDSFWSEDLFYKYLFRILTSWALVYDVYYLEAQTLQPGESADAFAARVQALIAEAADLPVAPFDGSVFYKKIERAKYHDALQQKCATEVASCIPSEPVSPSPSEGFEKIKFET